MVIIWSTLHVAVSEWAWGNKVRKVPFDILSFPVPFLLVSLMTKWLEQVSQWHEMYCHDLEVMSSNPGRVECGVHSTSVLVVFEQKYLCNTRWLLQHILYFLEYSLGLKLKPSYPSKLIESTVIKSWFRPSLDLNLGDFRPWNWLNPGAQLRIHGTSYNA